MHLKNNSLNPEVHVKKDLSLIYKHRLTIGKQFKMVLWEGGWLKKLVSLIMITLGFIGAFIMLVILISLLITIVKTPEKTHEIYGLYYISSILGFIGFLVWFRHSKLQKIKSLQPTKPIDGNRLKNDYFKEIVINAFIDNNRLTTTELKYIMEQLRIELYRKKDKILAHPIFTIIIAFSSVSISYSLGHLHDYSLSGIIPILLMLIWFIFLFIGEHIFYRNHLMIIEKAVSKTILLRKS